MNYTMINGVKTEITDDILGKILELVGNKKCLSEIEVGKTFKIGDYEFIVLEHAENGTVVILKDLLYENNVFGNNNNYANSNVDKVCNTFAETIGNIIGNENIIEHNVDLTAANGMTCYGTIKRTMSLLTLDNIRKYAHIFKDYKIDKWWWLATACGTNEWGTNNFALCVSPSGVIGSINYRNDYGVRPFCILKSNIFVSC